MYLVEKLGELIMVTMEGHVTSEEVEAVKHQIKEIAKMEDEAVVSLKLSKPDGSRISVEEEKSRYNEVIDFCNKSNIRIYSYVYEDEG